MFEHKVSNVLLRELLKIWIPIISSVKRWSVYFLLDHHETVAMKENDSAFIVVMLTRDKSIQILQEPYILVAV